jgi:hypothetical protein
MKVGKELIYNAKLFPWIKEDLGGARNMKARVRTLAYGKLKVGYIFFGLIH